MFLRPTRSDVDDQMKRPERLNSDRSPTNPAAAAAATVESAPSRKKSWIIGAACSRMPMPAVTLQNRTVHSSQNCGVLTALRADTFSVVTRAFFFTDAGSKPSGFQSAAGTRTRKAPNIMKTKYTAPRVRKSIETDLPLGTVPATAGS